MFYKDILKQLSMNENKSKEQIEHEMQQAITNAGLDCTAREFIEITSFFISKRRYIA